MERLLGKLFIFSAIFTITSTIASEHLSEKSLWSCPRDVRNGCRCLMNSLGTKFRCEKNQDEIEIRYHALASVVFIELSSTNFMEMCELLPNLNIDIVDEFFIRTSDPLNEALMEHIKYKLGVKHIRSLSVIFLLRSEPTSQTFAGLEMLEKLNVLGQPLSKADRSKQIHLSSNAIEHLRELNYLEIIGLNLEPFDDRFLRNQRKLKQFGMHLSTLKKLTKIMFDGTPNISELEFNDNEIDSVDVDAFENLVNLTKIDLSRNQLVKLPQGVFRANKNLLEVRLSQNILESLADGLLSQLPHLEKVSLQSNRLQSLPEDLFVESSNITEITFSFNLLKTIPPRIFHGQRSLLNLNFYKNKLGELPDDLFNNTIKLNAVNFEHNHLENVPENLFKHLNNLKDLNLRQNRLPIERIQLLKLPANLLIFIHD